MWEVIYDVDGISIMYDDGNDVWKKYILYSDIVEGIHKAFEEDHRRWEARLNSIIKEDNSNGTH